MINELLKIVKETLELVKEIENDTTYRTKKSKDEHITFFKIFYSQFDSIQSVLILLKENKYRDCLILLRTIFETYFFLWLMMEGRRYRETREFHIIPNSWSTKSEARDKTFEKWQKDKRDNAEKYKDIIDIKKGHAEDVITVTYEWEGLYEEKDVERKGEIVTKYFFAFTEYNPEIKHLASLPTILAGDLYPDISLKQQKDHKRLYHHYFYIESIVKNLRLNKLIIPEQDDRIWVHYNFLSMFTHTTNKGMVKLGDPRSLYLQPNRKYDEVVSELILLYLCALQSMYISTIIRYFKNKSDGEWYRPYEKQIEKLNNATKDFWFILNEPTDFDINESEQKKRWLRGRKMEVNEDLVIYYTDPIERLNKLKLYKK